MAIFGTMRRSSQTSTPPMSEPSMIGWEAPAVTAMVLLLQAITIGGLLSRVARRFGATQTVAGAVLGILVAAAIAFTLSALGKLAAGDKQDLVGGLILAVTGVYLAFLLGAEDSGCDRSHPWLALWPHPSNRARRSGFSIALWCVLVASLPVVATWVGSSLGTRISPAPGAAVALIISIAAGILFGRTLSRILILEIALISAVTGVVALAAHKLVMLAA